MYNDFLTAAVTRLRSGSDAPHSRYVRPGLGNASAQKIAAGFSETAALKRRDGRGAPLHL